MNKKKKARLKEKIKSAKYRIDLIPPGNDSRWARLEREQASREIAEALLEIWRE